MSSPAGGSLRKTVVLIIAALAVPIGLQWFDLRVSALFYRPDNGFFLDHAQPLQWVYTGTRWFTGVLAGSLIAALLYSLLPGSRLQRVWRGRIAFLILALATGPGLVTNTLLKDHFGRPRPEQIADFGGRMRYVPLPIPSAQCRRNCSFPSGHAAAGFYLITGAWIWPRQRYAWRATGAVAGALVGLVRIAQGGHFLSDVLGALAVVWICNELLFRFMRAQGWIAPYADAPSIRRVDTAAACLHKNT
jgi:lipid A 4'-phosphatase